MLLCFASSPPSSLVFPLRTSLTSCVQKRMHVKLSACHRNCRNDTVGHFRQDRGLYTLEVSTRRGRRRKVSIFNFLHLQWQTSGGPLSERQRQRGMRQFSVSDLNHPDMFVWTIAWTAPNPLSSSPGKLTAATQKNSAVLYNVWEKPKARAARGYPRSAATVLILISHHAGF